MADSLLDLAGVPGGTSPPENQDVLAELARMRSQYEGQGLGYLRQSGNPAQWAPWMAGETAVAASQPGMSGYFNVEPGRGIVPRSFTPQQVAQQAGLSDPRQIMQGFGPSGGYDEVGYNIPNDRGGFFSTPSIGGLPSAGYGLNTNNWRLLGRGPGYIMRMGNLINMLDPATRSGFPAGADISWNDTDASVARNRYIAPGAALRGSNIFGVPFWPGTINHPGYHPWIES